jgi:hypothetical protein
MSMIFYLAVRVLPEAGDLFSAIGASSLFYLILSDSKVDSSYQSLLALRAVGGVSFVARRRGSDLDPIPSPTASYGVNL